jgi:hypothetical protein
VLALTACAYLSPEPAPATLVSVEEGPSAEARAALVNLVSVAQRKDVGAFKQLLYTPDVPDFEAQERDHPGRYAALMAAISAAKPQDYRLELAAGSTATFTAPVAPKLGDYSRPAIIRVVLIRDGNQWKLGKA